MVTTRRPVLTRQWYRSRRTSKLNRHWEACIYGRIQVGDRKMEIIVLDVATQEV